MAIALGQSAPTVKGYSPWDKMPQNRHVPVVETERAYIVGLIKRTREARERMGWSQAHMADLLRVDREGYRMYERRTPLPHHLIESFCALTGADLHIFVTGKRAAQLGRSVTAPVATTPPSPRRRRA